MVKLTEKQKQFVREYLIDLNATQAAIRAGYSAKTADQQGSRMLANVKVQQASAKQWQSAAGGLVLIRIGLFWNLRELAL